RVHDNTDALVCSRLGDLFELANEGLSVARAGRLHPLSGEDGERELGEIIPCEKVEGSALDHLASGLKSIAKEGATISDAEGLRHAHVLLLSIAAGETEH